MSSLPSRTRLMAVGQIFRKGLIPIHSVEIILNNFIMFALQFYLCGGLAAITFSRVDDVIWI
jgi:hypothetical protein